MQQISGNADLGNSPISSLIAKFALPAILANLVGSLYNIADQIFIGQKLGTVGNAATNIAFPLVLLATMFSTMVGSGGASQFSLYQGAGKDRNAAKCVGNSLVALVVSGIALMAATLLFVQPLMKLFGAKGETLELAVKYTRIIAIGMPFQVFGAGASMFIRADGSPKYAMSGTLVGAVLNVILDPVFIFMMDMGMTGAALATIIGQIISALIVLVYFKKFKSTELSRTSFAISKTYLKQIFTLGLPAGLMQVAVMVIQIVMNNTLGYYGEQTVYGRDVPLAVSGVVTKINSIFTATILGISQSCQPVFGFNYGAKNFRRVKQTFRTTAVIVTAVSLVSFILFQLFPKQILEIFQQGDELYLTFGTSYLRIFMGAIIVNGITILASNFFPSIGMAKEGMVASLSRQVFFQLPLILIFPMIWGLNGVLYAGPVADVLAMLLCSALTYRVWKRIDTRK